MVQLKALSKKRPKPEPEPEAPVLNEAESQLQDALKNADGRYLLKQEFRVIWANEPDERLELQGRQVEVIPSLVAREFSIFVDGVYAGAVFQRAANAYTDEGRKTTAYYARRLANARYTNPLAAAEATASAHVTGAPPAGVLDVSRKWFFENKYNIRLTYDEWLLVRGPYSEAYPWDAPATEETLHQLQVGHKAEQRHQEINGPFVMALAWTLELPAMYYANWDLDEHKKRVRQVYESMHQPGAEGNRAFIDAMLASG